MAPRAQAAALVAAMLLALASSGCKRKKKLGPLFVRATATSATVNDYKDTQYARPEPREIVTLAVESHPTSMVVLTGVSTLAGKTSLEGFTDKDGKATLTFRYLDVKGPLEVEVISSDGKGAPQRAKVGDVKIERAPGLHVVYSTFEVVPGGCKGQVAGARLTATGCPAGTTLALGSASARSTGGPVKVEVDMNDRLLGLPATLDEARPTRIPMTLAITTPEGKSYSRTFEATGFERDVRERLSKVASGPVVFGPGDKKSARHGALVLEGRAARAVGDAQVARELDLVAFAEEAGSRTASCGTYVQRSTGNAKTLSITLADSSVTLYDRRTGRQVAKRVFRASGTCGATATAKSGGFYAAVDSADVDRWIKGFLR